MSGYTLTSALFVIRDKDQASIPLDPANIDYQEYLTWLSEGNTPNPYVPPPPPIPQEVPLWSVRAVLDEYGLLEQAQSLIVASNDTKLKMAWEYGNFVLRSSPSIETLAGALGLSSQQVDAMFIAASELTV